MAVSFVTAAVISPPDFGGFPALPMCLPRGGIQFLSVGVMDFPVGARIM